MEVFRAVVSIRTITLAATTCIMTRTAVCAVVEPGTVGIYVQSGMAVTTKTMTEMIVLSAGLPPAGT